MDKFDIFKSKACLLAAVLSVAGCMTIQNAWDAQEAYAPLGRDDAQIMATNSLDLSALSLSQLVDFAMTNRPSVAKAALAVEDARLALKQLRADAPLISETPWLSPRISVDGGYSASSASAPLRDLEWKTDGKPSAAVTLSIPIFDFGRHDARVKSQCEAVLDAELMLVENGYEVFYEVCDAYFGLLEKSAMLAVAQTNELEFALHLEQAERRSDAGEADPLDVLRARLDLAQAREKIVAAQSELDTAGAEFQKSLGIDASYGTFRDIYRIDDDPLTFVMRGFPDTRYSVREAFDLARTNAPSMRVMRSRLRAASADVDYAIADLMPEISASVSLDWTDPLWYWHWGVSAVQSVFQGFRKTTAVDRAVVAMRQAAKDVESLELDISLGLEKAVAQRDTALKAQETAEASLRSAQTNLDMVREQYQLGEVDRVEFTDSVAAYVASLANRIGAFYAKQRAECAVFALLGVYPVYEEKKITEEL